MPRRHRRRRARPSRSTVTTKRGRTASRTQPDLLEDTADLPALVRLRGKVYFCQWGSPWEHVEGQVARRVHLHVGSEFRLVGTTMVTPGELWSAVLKRCTGGR